VEDRVKASDYMVWALALVSASGCSGEESRAEVAPGSDESSVDSSLAEGQIDCGYGSTMSIAEDVPDRNFSVLDAMSWMSGARCTWEDGRSPFEVHLGAARGFSDGFYMRTPDMSGNDCYEEVLFDYRLDLVGEGFDERRIVPGTLHIRDGRVFLRSVFDIDSAHVPPGGASVDYIDEFTILGVNLDSALAPLVEVKYDRADTGMLMATCILPDASL